MSTLIQLRRGTAAAWTTANPVLHAGEAGVELNAGNPRAKVGDGVTAWASLPYLDAYVFTGGDQGALAMRDTGSANGYSWVPSEAGVLVSAGEDEIPVFRPLLAADIPTLSYSKLTLTGSIVDGDIVSMAWSKLTGTPSTLAGYGITDPIVLTSGSYANPAWITSLAGAKVTGTVASATAASTATLAAAATVLATPRTINGVSFDGSGNITVGAAAADITGTLGVANGGTGLATYVVGDLPYASGTTTLSKLSDVALGSVLISGGVGAPPSWSAVPKVTRYEFINTAGNTYVGKDVAVLNPSGPSGLTGVGWEALKDVTSSGIGYNSAFGLQAMWRTTTGEQNVGIGSYALRFNLTGGSNVAVGHGALATTTSANYNVAIGASAATNMVNGQSSVIIGYGAQFYTTSGDSNTSIGHHALFTNTTGSYNVSVGKAALYLNTTGSRNIGIGFDTGGIAAGTMSGTLSSASANLGIGQYNYRVAFVLAGAATGLGQTFTIATTSGNRQVNLTNIPTYSGPLVCTARMIFRSTAGDVNQATWKLLTTIADNTTTTFPDNIADASLGAVPTDISNSIVIGDLAYYWKAGQAVIGSDSQPITELWLGRGGYSATPDVVTFQPSGASGTNVAGANFIIAGSRGTGTAAGGDIIFQTTVAGSSGTAWNALAEVMRLKGANVGIGTSGPLAKLSVGGVGAATSTIYGIASGAGTMAVRGDGTGSGTSYGLYGTFSGSAGTLTTAVMGLNTSGTATSAYGVQGTSSGVNNGTNYGGAFTASGTNAAGGSINYGGWFTASGAVTNYGVYSAAGRNHFVGALETDSYIEQVELASPPSAPAADKVRIYAEDNGAGKTRLMALFATGAAQQIAIQP